MKHKWFLVLWFLLCLLVMAGSLWMAFGMMDSIYAYRSPLHATPPEPGDPVGESLTGRLIFVLIDGLRLDTANDPSVMPFLNELRTQAAWTVMNSRQPSYSAPGYSVIFIGAWSELNDGPVFNLSTDELLPWTQDNLFSAAQRSGLTTGVSAFEWFGKLIPAEAVTEGFFTPGEDQVADRAVVDAALPWLRSGELDLVLIHLDQVDYAGHYEGGVQAPGWKAAASRVDELLVEIAAEIDLTVDTLFICSDHGHVAMGGHGGGEPEVLREPFILVGAGVIPGEYPPVQMVDIAPTLATLLGLNLPAITQGMARSDMLSLAAESLVNLEIAQSIQQDRLADSYQASIGKMGNVPEEVNIVTAANESMQTARQARLNGDRLPRFVLAGILALLLIAVLFWKRSPHLARILAGALIFQVVYHIRYAVLLGKGYSFSYITDPTDLVLEGLVNALLAFAAAWLICCLGARMLNQGSRRAAEETLKLAMGLLIPPFLVVLWSYAMDGLFVGWALPDFGRTFLALFAFVQALMIGLWGLVFAGMAALAAALIRRK